MTAVGYKAKRRDLQRAALCHVLSWVVPLVEGGVNSSLGLLFTTVKEFC